MARRNARGRAINGWLILDKPLGMTSTQAVNVVKRLFDARKAGHAGTLDPLATGVLPIAFGEATKTMSYAVDGHKGYRFTVRWGVETSTDDAEGEVARCSDLRPKLDQIEAALDQFVGEIEQVPPKFSAIKIAGQRAYDLARDGEEVELKARLVEVTELRVVDMPDDDHAILEAECGKGTYVRAIARDLGRVLGCLGHVSALRRTRVGAFEQEMAVSLEDLRAAAQVAQRDPVAAPLEATSLTRTGEAADVALLDGCAADQPLLKDYLQPVAAPLDGMEELAVGTGEAQRLRRGQSILLRGRDAPVFTGPAYVTCKGQLVAVGDVDQATFVPTRVFNL
ncbi:MAG: tRNA pseudouridine(55) synthase TruB [Hyphomicrobiaceae bacterium]